MQWRTSWCRFFSQAGVLILLSCFLILSGCRKEGGQKGAGGPTPPEVGVVTITPRSVEITTELPGRASAYLVAEIRPQVSGIIEKRHFEEGSDITAGQLLYQIDPAPFQAALDSAEASLGRAKANLIAVKARADRYRDLLADRAVSQQDYDDVTSAVLQVEAEIKYWEAQVTTAGINLDYSRVTAPISGRIGRSSVTDGAMVIAYQAPALAVIQQLDPIYIDVTQSSAELLRFKQGLETGRISQNTQSAKKVRIVMEDGTAYPLEGTLQFRDVSVDPATGSITLRIVVPNPENLLLPGMYARAVISNGLISDALLAPQQGVSRTPKGEPVALVVDETGKVQQRILKLDRAIDDQWLVLDGLSAGDRVIVEGQLNVKPGAQVKAVSLDVSAPSSEKTADGGK
jgi:membrane fusion protein (multidrug efflux system)